MNLPVTENGVRPAGKQDECFYCNNPIISDHAPNCVLLKRTVVVRMEVEMVISVPRDWDEDMIDFHYNDSSSCANNPLHALNRWAEKDGNCICGAQNTSFVREATEEDHENLPLACEELDIQDKKR